MNRRELLLGVLLAPVIKPLAAMLPAREVVHVQDYGAILEEGLSLVFTSSPPSRTCPLTFAEWQKEKGMRFAVEKELSHWDTWETPMGNIRFTKNPYGGNDESEKSERSEGQEV